MHENVVQRTDQETEIREDAVRQLPYVSLATSQHTTLAEALSVLLATLPYTVVYGPQVEVTTPLTSHITHQRLDRAVATLVHPLGYQATVEPLRREIHIAAMLTRHWMLPPRPATDDRFWTQLGTDLRALVHGDRDADPASGAVVARSDDWCGDSLGSGAAHAAGRNAHAAGPGCVGGHEGGMMKRCCAVHRARVVQRMCCTAEPARA